MLAPAAGKSAMQNSLRHHALFHSNATNQFLQALALRIEHTPAECGQPVITAPRIIQFRCGPLVGSLDQSRLDQPLNRTIQSRWPQSHFPGTPVQDILHDSVAVLLSPCERKHDVKPIGLQWNKSLRITLSHVDIYITLYLYFPIVFLVDCREVVNS